MTKSTGSCRHLPKCFDNLHNLEFRKDAAGEPTKAAIGMYSGEGEYVAFTKDCMCEGPVEVWLQVRGLSDWTDGVDPPLKSFSCNFNILK